MLRRALERWQAMPKAERLPSTPHATEIWRWGRLYPEDGLVLKGVTRDLPRTGGPAPDDWRSDAWNQDFAWFRRAEAHAFLPAEPVVGAVQVVPRALVERLARFHLLDSVRGQVSSFPAEAVQEARLHAEVTAVDGDAIEVAFDGATRTFLEGHWPVGGFRDRDQPGLQSRGYDARLRGQARFDRARGVFVAFELIASGLRHGGTQFNARGDDREPAPMGVVLTLAGDTAAERIAPAFVWEYGWPGEAEQGDADQGDADEGR